MWINRGSMFLKLRQLIRLSSTRHTRIMRSSANTVQRFKEATRLVYGPFEGISDQDAQSWKPPESPGAGGHKGRYLWTDAFGVINFVTLFKETSSPVYLTLARHLVDTVHNVLGRTRDGSSRLPLATDAEPLKGGLRIGKTQESGSDGDGQYHHYLTLWMFALNRLAIATGEKDYNRLAIQLAQATHPHFVKRLDDDRVRMVWKISTDMKTVLVPSEGHLDAATGFVVYRLLQQTAGNHDGHSSVLQTEIADYQQLMSREGKLKASHDPLDLGMGLWMCHFFRGEDWARGLGRQSLAVARTVLDDERGVMARTTRRLAFREFGTCLGLECYGVEGDLRARVGAVVDFWQQHLEQSTDEDLRPITLVMYAAALIPGAFRDGYLEDR